MADTYMSWLLNICWQNATEVRSNTVLVDLHCVICQKLLWPSVITTVMIGVGTLSEKVQVQFLAKNRCSVLMTKVGQMHSRQFKAKHSPARQCMVDIKYWPSKLLTACDKYTNTNTDTNTQIKCQVHPHWYKMLAVTNCWPHVVSRLVTWCGLWPPPFFVASHVMTSTACAWFAR